ncbi:MAG: family 20 glycosylhydrolase [Vicinamibacteria bacterium]
MRYAIAALLLTFVAAVASAETPSLELRWELKEDVFSGPADEGASRVVFTLTNRGAKPLAGQGWAIYFSGMEGARRGSVKGGASIENLIGDLHRLVPSPDFAGLAPGASAEFEYLSPLVVNVSFVPSGPYIVFDDAPDKGLPLVYHALPFERPPQGGRDPRVVTPETQYALNEAVRDIPQDALPPIFPTPRSLETREGRLVIQAPPSVAAAPELKAEADLAKDFLRPYFAAPAKPAAATVRLEIGRIEGQDSPEAYTLDVDPKDGIAIVGNSAAGVFYGLQSLRTLLPAQSLGKGLTLPAMKIVDAPRFAYRGLHLDVARNFQPKATVLRTLDLMARYKLNAFHFHLTEDEGWRLEMPSLPELTTVGARRGHTLGSSSFLPPAYGSGPDVDKPFGSGFYTRADYTEILKYAAARHIEVIPEIEMPGHARAAVKAMEARFRRLSGAGDAEGARRFLLSDPGDTSVYTSAQNYHDNVMNPALPSTYAFIEEVVKELVELHRDAGVPLRNVHMGGDEVPAGVWEKSPIVQAYLKEHGLGSVDDLWFTFYGRVEQILKPHGVALSGWEEIGVRKTKIGDKPLNIPNPDFAGRGWRTYVWNNVPGGGAEDLAYRLANGGYKVVLAPVTNQYFDLASNKNPEEPGLDWGGYVDVDKPFQFIPFDYYRNVRQDRDGNPLDRSVFVGKDRLTDYGRSNVVGLEGCLWSETLGGDRRIDYMLVPKLLGLAERAWAPDPAWARETDEAKSANLYQDAWSEFVGVLGRRELPRLDRAFPGINYRIPTPGLKVVEGQIRCNLQIPGLTLRYTTDGREPTAKSLEVRGPIPAKGRVRVAAFDSTGRKGHTAEVRVP